MTICPNCGSSHAERHELPQDRLLRIQCPECDYFLLACTKTNRPIEVYAPGVDLHKFMERTLKTNPIAHKLL
jgi:transposase-like protein